ncbi:hypothetical protein C0993_000119 [Termitomyces sp. T159_Od127]|nr:hypothetical protein C0993_000119 [Termitomyces sp. T159_Od127]
MPASQRVIKWVDGRFRKPRVDPEWLDQCYDWVINSDLPLDPDTDFDALTKKIEYQLLQSNFSDSMLPGTGLPTHIAHPDTKVVLTGQEILVEVVALTEIGHSAFSLNQTRLAREERMKEGNIVDDPNQEGDIDVAGEGPIPKYSRGMLHFQLTDGTTTVPAIEYRPLPQLSLQDTPLGYKLKLKDVRVQKGIVWLEPKTVILLGEETQERNENREADFAKGLRGRMNLPETTAVMSNNVVARQIPVPCPPVVRSPLREITPPPSPPAVQRGNDDEGLENRRRRIPVPETPASSRPIAASSDRANATTSSYFADSITSRSQTLVGSRTPIMSLSPTIRQTKPNLSPPLEIQHEDEYSQSDDENNKNLRTWLSPGERRFVDDFGALALNFLGRLRVRRGLNQNPTGSLTNNNVNGSSRRKGKEKQAETGVSSDEYDDDIVFDNDVFAGLDAMEMAMEHPSNTQPISTVGSGSSGVGVRTRVEEIEPEVITIEESDDDDKENNPVPTRHVRQRIESSVIELSDSD